MGVNWSSMVPDVDEPECRIQPPVMRWLSDCGVAFSGASIDITIRGMHAWALNPADSGVLDVRDAFDRYVDSGPDDIVPVRTKAKYGDAKCLVIRIAWPRGSVDVVLETEPELRSVSRAWLLAAPKPSFEELRAMVRTGHAGTYPRGTIKLADDVDYLPECATISAMCNNNVAWKGWLLHEMYVLQTPMPAILAKCSDGFAAKLQRFEEYVASSRPKG